MRILYTKLLSLGYWLETSVILKPPVLTGGENKLLNAINLLYNTSASKKSRGCGCFVKKIDVYG